jgi:4-aminobutyrate--pyruvate transaminase
MRNHGLLHAYTDLGLHERTGSHLIERGEGICVYDADGNEYIEGVAGLYCVALGFGESALIEAAVRQLRALPTYHIVAGRTAPVAVALADRMLALAPVPLARVFFTNSGSEANDTQIKLHWLYNNIRGFPRKKKIISRRRAYHGATIASGSLTGIESNHANFDLPQPYVRHVSAPCHWADARAGEDEEAYAARLAQELDDLIEAEGADTVAAFIAEPVMAAGGVLIPPAGYFERVQEVLCRHDVRLIVDEVVCGYGRLGAFWGSDVYGLQPAGISCAKAMTSGYMPMGAVMIDEDMHAALASESDRAGTFAHGFTFSGHPVPAAVALRTLELFEERDIVAHVRHVAPHFEAAVHSLREQAGVSHTRAIGLLGAVQFDGDDAATVADAARRNGLLLRPLGKNAVALCPPLIIDEDGIEAMISRLASAISELPAGARSRARALHDSAQT